MPTFGECLKQLRTDKKLAQKDMAQYLNIAANAYQNYEYNKKEMNIKILTILAGCFDVSVDYLIGRTDDPTRQSRYTNIRKVL